MHYVPVFLASDQTLVTAVLGIHKLLLVAFCGLFYCPITTSTSLRILLQDRQAQNDPTSISTRLRTINIIKKKSVSFISIHSFSSYLRCPNITSEYKFPSERKPWLLFLKDKEAGFNERVIILQVKGKNTPHESSFQSKETNTN